MSLLLVENALPKPGEGSASAKNEKAARRIAPKIPITCMSIPIESHDATASMLALEPRGAPRFASRRCSGHFRPTRGNLRRWIRVTNSRTIGVFEARIRRSALRVALTDDPAVPMRVRRGGEFLKAVKVAPVAFALRLR